MRSNNERALRAKDAVAHYAADDGGSDELEATITDLLADLMHLADQQSINLDSAFLRARANHQAEIREQ